MPATALSALTVSARLILTTNEAGRHDFPFSYRQNKNKKLRCQEVKKLGKAKATYLGHSESALHNSIS